MPGDPTRAVRDKTSAKAMHHQRDAAILYGQARYMYRGLDRRMTARRHVVAAMQQTAADLSAEARDLHTTLTQEVLDAG